MTDITSTTRFRQGAFSAAEVRAVVVHDGRRGPKGLTGEQGEPGPQGDGFLMKGVWVNGATYCPGDAVTATSTGLGTLSSLFIQLEGVPCSVSAVEPKDDPARWSEVGLTAFDDNLGAVWEVEQAGHPFTEVGTPATWVNDRWEKAQNTTSDRLALAVVREIVDANRFYLQTSGKLADPDPAIILEGGSFVDGGTYFLSTVLGFVTINQPADGFIVPVLHITGSEAVVFPYPWDPVDTPVPPAVPGSSRLKLDNISAQFDGVKTDFPLTVGSAPVAFGATESFEIFIDGNAQEPLVDFVITDTAGDATISFTTPPEDYAGFWGVYFV